jgi:predicted nucleic acid-binding protein
VIVVDTNVIGYLWLPGGLTPAAENVLSRDAEWAVPLLWRSEFRSVLAGAVRGKRFSLAHAAAVNREAEDQLRGREFQVESAQVLSLAASSGCSTYDCEFVALARGLGVPLVTNDRQVLRAFPDVAAPLASYA